MKKAVMLFVAAVVLLQGCGMVIHGEMQDLAIATVPSGATARVGKSECVTPCTMRVMRHADSISFTKGSLKEEYYLDKSLNWGASVFGNILWIAPGLIVDLIGGGAYTIKPVNVRLGEEDSR